MVRPDRANLAANARLDELLSLLLRQFKRPLAARGIEFSDGDANAIASAIVSRAPVSEKAMEVREGLIAAITQSEEVLRAWNLTFEQSLETGMDTMPGWESTADFLSVANEKANAELRIASASALVTALGDPRYLSYVRYLAARRSDDMDEIIARRVLDFTRTED